MFPTPTLPSIYGPLSREVIIGMPKSFLTNYLEEALIIGVSSSTNP
ncbi:MAG: hypothetical protein H7223_11690 [Pedobacter sp.]|nr:hypothetical protein [Pedobacter sp.]